MPTSSQALTLLKKVSDLNDLQALLQDQYVPELDQSRTMLYMGQNAYEGDLSDRDGSLLDLSLPFASGASYRSVTPPPSSLVSSCKTTPRSKVNNTANTEGPIQQEICKELNHKDGYHQNQRAELSQISKQIPMENESYSKCPSRISHKKYPSRNKTGWSFCSGQKLASCASGWPNSENGQFHALNPCSQIQKVGPNPVSGGHGDFGLSDKEVKDVPRIVIEGVDLEQGDQVFMSCEDGVCKKDVTEKETELSVKVLPSPEQIQEANWEELGSKFDEPHLGYEENAGNDISYVGIQTYDHRNGRYAWSLYPHRSLVNIFALRSKRGKEIRGHSNSFYSSSISYVSEPRTLKRLNNPKVAPSIFELALLKGRKLDIRGALGVSGSQFRRLPKREQFKNQSSPFARKPETTLVQYQQSTETLNRPKSTVTSKVSRKLPAVHEGKEPINNQKHFLAGDSRPPILQSLDTNEQNASPTFLSIPSTETDGISISEALDFGSRPKRDEQELEAKTRQLSDESLHDRLGRRNCISSLSKLPPIGEHVVEKPQNVKEETATFENQDDSHEKMHDSAESEPVKNSTTFHLAPSGVINQCNYNNLTNRSSEEEQVYILVPNCEISTEMPDLGVDSSVGECSASVQKAADDQRVAVSDFYEPESNDKLDNLGSPKNETTFTGLSPRQKKRLIEAKRKSTSPKKMEVFKEEMLQDYDWTAITCAKDYEPITLDMPVITPPIYSKHKTGESTDKKLSGLTNDDSTDSESEDLYRPQQHGLRMRRELPPCQPNKLCFRTPLTGCTHAEVKSEIETQRNVKVIFLQYDPIYIQAHPTALQSDRKNYCMWVFELSPDSAKAKLLLEGFKLRDMKMNVRHVDDIYKEECRAFALYQEVYREQRSKKLSKRNERRAMRNSGNFLVR